MVEKKFICIPQNPANYTINTAQDINIEIEVLTNKYSRHEQNNKVQWI